MIPSHPGPPLIILLRSFHHPSLLHSSTSTALSGYPRSPAPSPVPTTTGCFLHSASSNKGRLLRPLQSQLQQLSPTGLNHHSRLHLCHTELRHHSVTPATSSQSPSSTSTSPPLTPPEPVTPTTPAVLQVSTSIHLLSSTPVPRRWPSPVAHYCGQAFPPTNRAVHLAPTGPHRFPDHLLHQRISGASLHHIIASSPAATIIFDPVAGETRHPSPRLLPPSSAADYSPITSTGPT